MGKSRHTSLSPAKHGRTQPGLSRLRRLAPAITPRSSHPPVQVLASIEDRRLQKVCRVRQCNKPGCQLRSHLQYRQDQGHLRRASTATSTATQASDLSSAAPVPDDGRPGAEDDACLPLLHAGVDGHPALPLDDDQAVYGELFHHFFTYQYDCISHLLMPRPVTPLQRRRYRAVKTDSLGVALSESVFCLHFCAASHHQLVFRPDGPHPTKLTAFIRHNLMKLLRHKLKALESRTSKAADVILVILTLVMFETSFGDFSALSFHRRAMQCLAKLHGGVHNLGRHMPYVLVLDRLIALFSNLPPVWNTCPDRAIRRPLRFPCVYGGFFEPSQVITSGDPDVKAVHDYCFDVCRAIEMMEVEGLSFVPSTNPRDQSEIQSPDVHYFYFMRETLGASFVHLNARLASVQRLARSPSRLLLLGSKIIEYSVLQDCYMVSIPKHLANIAQEIVQEMVEFQGDSAAWSGQNASIVRWVLFTLCSMPLLWDGQRWALRQLSFMLTAAYGGTAAVHPSEMGTVDGDEVVERGTIHHGASTWIQCEHDNVRQFVWSNCHFDSGFVATCNALSSEELATDESSPKGEFYNGIAFTSMHES